MEKSYQIKSRDEWTKYMQDRFGAKDTKMCFHYISLQLSWAVSNADWQHVSVLIPRKQFCCFSPSGSRRNDQESSKSYWERIHDYVVTAYHLPPEATCVLK
jgi:hypothetical protein